MNGAGIGATGLYTPPHAIRHVERVNRIGRQVHRPPRRQPKWARRGGPLRRQHADQTAAAGKGHRGANDPPCRQQQCPAVCILYAEGKDVAISASRASAILVIAANVGCSVAPHKPSGGYRPFIHGSSAHTSRAKGLMPLHPDRSKIEAKSGADATPVANNPEVVGHAGDQRNRT